MRTVLICDCSWLAAELAEESADFIETVFVEGRYLSLDKIDAVKTPTPIIDVPLSGAGVDFLKIPIYGQETGDAGSGS